MTSKSVKSQLEEKTVLQLKKLASKKDIQGRSTMKKSQLVKALMKGGSKRLNQSNFTLRELQSIINAKYTLRENKRSNGEELTNSDYMYYVKYEYDRSTNNLIPRTSVLLSVQPFTSFSPNRFLISYYSEKFMKSYNNIAELNQLILSDDGSTIIHIYNEDRNTRDFAEIINSTENIRSKNARETHAINIMKRITQIENKRREMYAATGDSRYLPGANLEAFFESKSRQRQSRKSQKPKDKTYNKPRKGNKTHNFRRNFNNHEPVYENGSEKENYEHLEYPEENNWWYPSNSNSNSNSNTEEEYYNYYANNGSGADAGAGYFANNGSGANSGNVRSENGKYNKELLRNENFQTLLRNPRNKKSYHKLALKFHPNKARAKEENGAAMSEETKQRLLEENKRKKTKQFQTITGIYQGKK